MKLNHLIAILLASALTGCGQSNSTTAASQARARLIPQLSVQFALIDAQSIRVTNGFPYTSNMKMEHGNTITINSIQGGVFNGGGDDVSFTPACVLSSEERAARQRKRDKAKESGDFYFDPIVDVVGTKWVFSKPDLEFTVGNCMFKAMRGGGDSTVEFLDEDKGIVVTGFQLNLILSNASPVTLFSPAIRGIDDAIDAGDIDAVADLIAKDSSCVNRTTGYGMSPINLAALRGHVAIVKMLIAKGASAVEPTGSGESGLSTPLHKAAEGGHKDVAELLLANHADVNAKDNQGATPLHWAAAYDHQDVVELLLTNNADVNAKANDGATPLHYAAYGRQTNVVELLLANKADVNAKDNKGYTPLHFAVANQRKDVADLLRQHGGHE
jgi:hypothetical protein